MINEGHTVLFGDIANRAWASLAYENIVGFSRYFYETIFIEKFPSREISQKCASRRFQIITQLYPINRNFTGSRCNIIANLNAATHGRCRTLV